MIATSWRHTTARAVAGQIPDPQLHSHVLLHGAVRGDGRIVAIDSRAWFTHSRELGAAYRTELACELHALGLPITRATGRAGRYFEVTGIPQALIDRWSSRHRQVRAVIDAQLHARDAHLQTLIDAGGEAGVQARVSLARLRETGRLPAGQDRRAALETRAAKQPRSHADLDAGWRATATQHGISPVMIKPAPAAEAMVAVDREQLLSRLTEFHAHFTARDARAAALEASVGLPIDEALQPLTGLRRDGELLRHADGSFTTRRHRAVEHATVDRLTALASGRVIAIHDATVRREVRRLSAQLTRAGGALTSEQADAITLACADRQLVVIEGQAGTGKSTVLSAAARAHQVDGQRIIVTSTAALAAQRLADDLRDNGVHADAYSTAGLHAALDGGRERLDAQVTVIHDEAALASTHEQHRLFTAVGESGARLIEVGDPRQSQPVGAGGLWSELHQTAQRTHAHQTLTRNVRALDPADRRDQQAFRDGDTLHALRGYAARGRVRIDDDIDEVSAQALGAAQEDRRAGRVTLVIAQTSNESLDQLNAQAQSLRHQDGELTGAGIPMPGRPYELMAGDTVQIRRTVIHPDAPEPLRNGTTAHVSRVDADREQVTLRLSERQEVTLDHDQMTTADLRLAYVQHPFPAQGQTSDTAHVIIAGYPTQEGSYVALTRARQHTTIYAARDHEGPDEPQADPLTQLAARMSLTEPEVPSIHLPLAHEDHITHQIKVSRSPSEPAVAPTPNTPPDHVIDALGSPPPPGDSARMVWETGAQTIERYRERHAIPDTEPTALGPQPPAGQFTDRVAHRETAAQLTMTARELGHTPPDAQAARPIRPTAEDSQSLEDTRDRNGFEP